MALDGIFLHLLCKEFESLNGCRIEKIYQPSRDELVLFLRSAGVSEKLLISAKSGFSRIGLTDNLPENPTEPPNFCKLLRKYIGGAKVIGFEQFGLDRTLFIRLSCYNEMGDLISPFLAVELFSNRSNIILCEESGRIIDAIHRSDIESKGRLLLPGAEYMPLEPSVKLNPFSTSPEEMSEAVISSEKPLGAAFMSVIDGVSPLISRELALLCGGDIDTEAKSAEKGSVIAVLSQFKEIILSKHTPTLISSEQGLSDFTYMPITQYGSDALPSLESSYSRLLDEFYSLRDKAARLKALSHDLVRLLSNTRSRIERRLSARLSELEQSRDREHLRIYGELLKANLYAIPKGADSAEVQNYYEPELPLIKIPLNPAISPAANAARYFKDYKKLHTAEQTLQKLIEGDRLELDYIESVLDSLLRCESSKELEQIRDELTETGYLYRKAKQKHRQPVLSPKKYTDRLGFNIMVGRNNRENDNLTLKVASKEDIWLHTKDIPGSHVIILTEGKEVGEETIRFAAGLAAEHSKAAESDNVPVDYTLVKYVKKPSGAKPGMVIYTHNKTLYVTPKANTQIGG